MHAAEASARAIKAARLADVLADLGCEADDATHLDSLGWKLAARAAGVNVPSERTQRLVIDLLRDRATRTDPWAGLPS